MKIRFPSTTLAAMALYGTSYSSAFSSIGSQGTIKRISAKNIASLFSVAHTMTNVAATKNTPSTIPFLSRNSRFASSTALASSSSFNPPFTTWSFDEACKKMDINNLSSASIAVSGSTSIDALNDTDLLVVGVFSTEPDKEEDEEKKSDVVPQPSLVGLIKELDEKYDGAIKDIMMENYKDFQHGAKAGTASPTLRVVGSGSKAKRIILVGLGKEHKDLESGTMGKIGQTIASKCDSEKKVSNCTLILPSKITPDNSSLEEFSTHFYSSLYSDNRYRTGDKKKVTAEDLKEVAVIMESGVSDQAGADAFIQAGKSLAMGVSLAKDIVNAPHNVLNSESLANVARQIAEESGGRLKCTILNKKECEERGMGAYLGVARGSETEPQFIHLAYSPPSGKASKKIGIVGKGLLFDTGGYNIKTAMMELMKFDCGGSAAVIGAAKAVAQLAPEDVEAHFVVAACENMINSRAVVPSDVLTASNGKTIEVINTDAEGRLTLADALVYVDKEIGCESIIELSTLTGACMVSLGTKVCGIWTSNDDLAKDLEKISKDTGDKSWRMPLEKEYNDQLKSNIADLKNCGTRYGGAITAALFLQNFVNSKKPFAHIDIAGPVWDDKIGATGFGAKMVTEWVVRQGSKGE